MRSHLLVLAAVGLMVVAGVAWSADRPTPVPTAQPGPTVAAAGAADKDNPVGTQTDIPVSTVVLYSSGVGYFEHSGTVDGDANTRLMFKTEQINDMLKSMVVMDLDGGTVQRIGYGSREPLERALKSFGVDISGAPTLAELLRQLRGTEVVVNAPEKTTGKVLNVESKLKVVGTPPTQMTEELLDLVADDGSIGQIPVATIKTIRLADERLGSELNKALALLVAARDKDRKPVDIQFSGKGVRHVRIGYIMETPVWKTSYRLDLGKAKDENAKPFMQGWAIVDNTTDADWAKVGLTLVSGRPISFVQDLYTPLYVPRPVVVPELYASLMPKVYEEGIAREGKVRTLTPAERSSATGSAGGTAGTFGASGTSAFGETGATGGPGGGLVYSGKRAADINLAQGVASLAEAAKVGELFQYTLKDQVNLARRQSAMLPIINQGIKAEKVSIYNAATLPKNPLNGIYLTNDTGLKMLAGPVTVFDGGMYAGDARLDNLAPNDKRLLGYAVDLSVTVDPTDKSSTAVTAIRVVKGVLEVTSQNTFTQDYLIHNKADGPRTMIVEHPLNAGRKLVAPKEVEEKTPSVYRFRVPVAAGETGKFTVIEEQPDRQTLAILGGTTETFAAYTSSGRMSKAVKDALAKAMTLKEELHGLQSKLDQTQQQAESIKSGQGRLRDNIKAAGGESQLGKRYLTKLNEEEDQIEKLDSAAKELRDQAQRKQKELDNYLATLNVE
jgi:hypothetical protein